MDKIKIGRFMAQCRREKQLTQEQLAAQLNVSNKSVSKWENGICLPDPSLYEPLCGILGVTLAELFGGQRANDAAKELTRMLKRKMYALSDQSVPFEAFANALDRIAEVTVMLKSFANREEAVRYFMKETGASWEECSRAYDFYTRMFDENRFGEAAQ